MANPLRDFIVPYSKGEVVFKEGDAGAEMYVVQTGQIELFRNINDEKRFVRVFEKGDFFGEMSLLEGHAPDRHGGGPRGLRAHHHQRRDLRPDDQEQHRDRGPDAPEDFQAPEGDHRPARARAHEPGQGGGHPRRATNPRRRRSTAGEAPPVLAEFVAEGSLKVFPIYREISLVGRKDPVTGITPDVDLTEEDVKRSVSRRHAKLICSNGQFYIAEEVGTLNGTFINGKRIPTGVLTPIKSGAQVGFGMLRFKFVERAHAGTG